MKNILVLCFACIAWLQAATAQQLPNSGFENWSLLNEYIEPDGWISTNAYAYFGAVETCYPTEQARTGKWAAQLETRKDPNTGDTLKAIMVCGTQYEFPGLPFEHRPTVFSFYYKTNARDTAAGLVVFTKWNTVAHRRDTIAVAFTFFTDSVNAYTLRTMPLSYLSTATPDSCSILFTTSLKTKPAPGNYLVLDDLQMAGFLSVTEIHTQPITLYPNPATNFIDAEIPGNARVSNISVWSLDGKIHTSQASFPITTAQLPPAVYILQAQLENGEIYTGRFIKK